MSDRLRHLSDRALYRQVYEVDLTPGAVPAMCWGEPRLSWALSHLGKDDDVLDVGCHMGEMTRYLAFRSSGRCVGIDISVNSIQACRQIYAGLPMHWMVADAEVLPVAADSFDVVVLSEILEHVPDPAAAIREAERIARDGGKVVLSVPMNAHGMELDGQAEAEARGAVAVDVHVREYLPHVELAGKPDLRCFEAGFSGGYNWRLASFRVVKDAGIQS